MSTANPDNVVVIGPSTLKLLATLGLGGCGMTAGVAFLLAGLFGASFLQSTGWIIVAIVGSGVVGALAMALIRRRPKIEIGPEGFVVHALIGKHSRRWSDIAGDFVVIRIGYSQAVGYRLTEACQEATRFQPTTLFSGNDAAISGAFAVSMTELANILNDFRARNSG